MSYRKIGFSFLVVIVGIPLGTMAFWPFTDPLQKLEEVSAAYNDWSSYRDRNDRYMKRTLFSAHCSAIDAKEVRGEQIQDARFLKPCRESDIELYFKVRAGDFPQVVR